MVKLRVCGVDDAGRGCVIGPLVIAGVLVSLEGLRELEETGIIDSKLLSPRRREKLAKEIEEIALATKVIKVSPSEVDEAVLRGRRLNLVEAKYMAVVINKLRPNIVYVDASDVRPGRFESQIRNFLEGEVEMICEHKADLRYPVVSAASIIAKVNRDAEIKRLHEKYGDFGSGYPNDPRTIKFLRRWISRYGKYPGIVRKSWSTARKIEEEVLQRKLSGY
jgi:ribonuclease HII